MADPAVVVLFIVVFIGFWLVNYLLQRKKAKNSLTRIETTYGTLKVFSGVFMGLGFAYLLEGNLTSEDLTNQGVLKFFGSLPGIILILGLGFILYFMSTSVLGENIFRPVREFGTSSSVFGKKTSYLNLPETGAAEMIEFAHNFNSNTLDLANRISIVNVHIDNLEQVIPSITTVFNKVNPAIESVESLIHQIEDIQIGVDNELVANTTLTEKGEEIKAALDQTIFDMISQLNESYEMLNLLTINIAIEAANNDNEAFLKIAEQSREFYKGFENFSEQISRKFVDLERAFGNTIDTFKEGIKSKSYDINLLQDGIMTSKKQLRDIDKISGEMDTLKRTIEGHIHNIRKDFPTDY